MRQLGAGRHDKGAVTHGIGPSSTLPPPTLPSPAAAAATNHSATGSGAPEPELRIYAPRSTFREILRDTRGARGRAADAAPAPARAGAPAADGGATSAPPASEPLRGAAVELLRDVARGERFVRSVMRRAARGEDFTPQELLAIQAGVYRYTQELELVSKIVDKGTAAVRQTLQSQT